MLSIVLVFTVLTSTKMLSVRRVATFHSSTAASNFYQSWQQQKMWLCLELLVGRYPSLVCYISGKLCITMGSNSYWQIHWIMTVLKLFYPSLGERVDSETTQTHNNSEPAFRHVIVDKVFVLSTPTHCTLNQDKILLDISNATLMQERPKKHHKAHLPLSLLQLQCQLQLFWSKMLLHIWLDTS